METSPSLSVADNPHSGQMYNWVVSKKGGFYFLGCAFLHFLNVLWLTCTIIRKKVVTKLAILQNPWGSLQAQWKTIAQKLNIELVYDPAIPLLAIYSKELKAGT